MTLCFERGETIYENPLACRADIEAWRLEGDAAVTFPLGRMRLEGTRDPVEGQQANFVLWCDQSMPDHLAITWDFYPIHEPGLCIFFFSAKGRDGKDVLDPSLASRSGPYDQYHSGDINALHVSYFRRKSPHGRAFTTCNLRKSYGAHLVAQGGDPLPCVLDATPPYRIELVKAGPHVQFGIGGGEEPVLPLFHWIDDGETHGPVLSDGRVAFRQMTPMIAEYANLKVQRVALTDEQVTAESGSGDSQAPRNLGVNRDG